MAACCVFLVEAAVWVRSYLKLVTGRGDYHLLLQCCQKEDHIHELPIGELSSRNSFQTCCPCFWNNEKSPITVAFAGLIMLQAKAAETQHVPQQVWSIVEPQNISEQPMSMIYHQQQDPLGQTLTVCPTYDSFWGHPGLFWRLIATGISSKGRSMSMT